MDIIFTPDENVKSDKAQMELGFAPKSPKSEPNLKSSYVFELDKNDRPKKEEFDGRSAVVLLPKNY